MVYKVTNVGFKVLERTQMIMNNTLDQNLHKNM